MESKQAIGYCRCSTTAQAEEGVSLEAQKAKIEAWAIANGYTLLAVHVDAGLSGGKAHNRPGLQSALADACKTKGALVVYSLSRLARSTKDAIAISEQLDKCGADLISLSEAVDTRGAIGKMFYRLMSVLNEFERDQVSERTKAALAHLRNQGKRVTRCRYGYNVVDDQMEPNPKEQGVIGNIKSWRSVGLSYHKIADRLNGDGIKGKMGGKWSGKSVYEVYRSAITA